MKRVMQVLCLVVLLIASVLPVSAAAETLATYELVSNATTIKAGETVTVTVAGKSLLNAYGAEIELVFDNAKLEYQSYSSSLSNKAFVMEPKVNGNKILLVYTFTSQNPGVSGDVDLFSITFKAVGAGNSSVGLKTVTALNHQGQALAESLGNEISVTVVANNNTIGPGPIVTPTSDQTLDSTPGVITVDAGASVKGVASTSVALKELLVAAELSKDRSILIQVKQSVDTKEVQVKVPVGTWNHAASLNNIDIIKIETGFATVSLDTKVLKESKISDGSNLQLTIAKVDSSSLPQDVGYVIGTSVVYDFTLMLDGQKLSSFSENEIRVELPYVLKPQENPSQVIIYYIADNGKLQIVRNGWYNSDTGKIGFKASHFSKYTAKHAPVSFQDMNGYDWANQAVLGLAAREVIKGRSEGYFVPEGQVTRAEFVQMLTSLFELNDDSATTAFTDVEPDAWYASAVASAQKIGLVKGKVDGSFGVNDQISREDMAVLIYRTLKLFGTKTEAFGESNRKIFGFLDMDRTSIYAKDAVAALQQADLMNGVTEGNFEPKNSSTRAQAASVLYRLYQLIESN